MEKTTITKLLGEFGLPEEVTTSLHEAFKNKIEETEMKLREEYAARYENDKAVHLEALDRMLTDLVTKQEESTSLKIQEFSEARNAYRKALRELRKEYKTKVNETLDTSRNFVKTQLVKEVQKLREERKLLIQERLATSAKLDKLKKKMAEGLATRIAKIDEFVVEQTRKELNEFHDDHRALIETRIKLVAESRKKLSETQKLFVKEAAKSVEQKINETLVNEMKQLHEDLERNRQNIFGRKIFEAVASEFMSSYYTEGTELRKTQKVLEAKEKALLDAQRKLDEVVKENLSAARKTKLAEERAVRSKTMTELLGNLRGEKRTIMEGMLETVKTDSLRETFNKLLPMVLDESRGKSLQPSPKRSLVETVRERQPLRSGLSTGDSRSATRIYENNNTDNSDIEQDTILRLAGIQK